MPSAVTPVTPHELLPALRFLFPGGSDFSVGRFDSSGVFVAHDAGGGVGGAILVHSMPGALGLIEPPRAPSSEIADQLVETALGWLRERGVKVCEAFSSTGETTPMAPLERHGFRHITEVVTLRRPTGDEVPQSSLEFRAECPPFSTACRAVLLSIHEGTLDCPELNTGRTADELLAEFSEQSAKTSWHFGHQNELPVGIAMLAPGAEENEVELAYLGVVPDARGYGISGNLLTFAMSEAALRGASSICVSVDERNWPALRLYQRHGFAETERRSVWLAHFS